MAGNNTWVDSARSRRTSPFPRVPRKVATIALAVSLIAAACGSRLDPQQMALLRGSTQGGLTVSPTGPGGGGTTTGPDAAAGTSATTSPNIPGAGTAVTGSAGGQTQGGIAAVAGGSGTRPGTGASSSTASSVPGSAGHTCAPGIPSSDPGVTATTITLGNVSTISGGPTPGIFAGARQGAQAAVNYINATGGVCGRKLVLDALDDNFDNGTNESDTQELIAKVLGFAGSFSVNETGGVPILQANPGVPDVGFATTPQRFTLPNNFSPAPEPPTGYFLGPYKYFAAKFGPKVTHNMAVFIEDNGVAQAQGEAEVSALESIGYVFTVKETAVEPTQSDFSAEIQEMKDKGVQGIIFQATAEIYGEMASQMYAAGFSVPFANWAPTAYDPVFLQSAGPGANGSIITTDFALYQGQDQTPAVQTFQRYWQETNPGSTPDLFALFGWASVILFVDGINAGGAPTRAATMAGLRSIKSFSANGLFAPSDPAEKQPSTCWVAIDVKDDQFVRDPASPSGFTCSPSGYG